MVDGCMDTLRVDGDGWVKVDPWTERGMDVWVGGGISGCLKLFWRREHGRPGAWIVFFRPAFSDRLSSS